MNCNIFEVLLQNMNISNLQNVLLPELVAVFNQSFADYSIKIEMADELLTSKMRSENIKLKYSVGVFEKGALVAFILHGVDENGGCKTVYNGGTGVLPAYRGMQLTKKMYEYIIPLLSADGYYEHQLEVLEGNDKALKIYEDIGFKVVRKVGCYKGIITEPPEDPIIKVIPLQDDEWKYMKSLWDVYPTWQNTTSAISRNRHEHIVTGVKENDILIGYCIMHKPTLKLRQIMVHRNYRNLRIGRRLLFEILKLCNGKEVNVVGVDESSHHLTEFFKTSGITFYARQLEMKLTIQINS